LVNLLIERSSGSVDEARADTLEASGIEQLEMELDRRFFRRAAIIKQRLTRVKATGPVQSGLMLLSRRIKEIETDHHHFKDLASASATMPRHEQWLLDKAAATLKESEDLDAYAVAADRQWLVEKERMDMTEQDLIFLEKMDRNPEFVESRDCDSIRKLLASATTRENDDRISIEVLHALMGRYQHFINGPNKQIRELFEHLIQRIQNDIQARLQPPR